MTTELIKKIDLLIESGRSWRAKEILRGKIGREEYSADLYRIYGEVLLSFGEMYEAGKYLFLSGSENNPAHDEAIEIFLSRHTGKGVYGFFSLLPRKFTMASNENYPRSVLRYIEAKGYKKKVINRIQRGEFQNPDKFPLFLRFIFGSVAMTLMLSIFVGLWVISSEIYSWLF